MSDSRESGRIVAAARLWIKRRNCDLNKLTVPFNHQRSSDVSGTQRPALVLVWGCADVLSLEFKRNAVPADIVVVIRLQLNETIDI